MAPLTVSLTGRLQVRVDGSVLDDERVPGRQARLVLAYLLLEHDRPVPRAELAEVVWGETPPPTWEKALTGLVGKLRRLLAECGLDARATLTNAFGCYQLLLPPGSSIDVEQAIAAADEADRAYAAGELATAHDRAALAASLAGRPLLPGEDGGWVEERRRLLHDVRLRALDRLADVDVATGDLAEALASAEAAVREEPFRETGYQRLMRIHAAAGNTAEALRVFESLRRLLRDELGTTPSATTRAIHLELLGRGGTEERKATPAPDGGGPVDRRRSSRSRIVLAAAAAVALAASAAVGREVAGRSNAHSLHVTPNSLVAVDVRTLRPVAQVPVGVRPGAVVSAAGSLWVANLDDRTVSRIDPGSAALLRTIKVPDMPDAMVAGAGSVWVASANPGLAHVTVRRIEPRFDTVTSTTPVPASPNPYGTAALAFGRGSVWVAPSLGSIARVSPRTAAILSSFDPYASATGIAAGQGAVWLVDGFGDTVMRLDATGATRTTPVGNAPSAIALGAGSVWVANGLDGTVSRVDPATGATRTTVRVGRTPSALAIGAGAAWVANARDGSVSRVDLRTNRVETIRVGGSPSGLALAGGRLWVTVAAPLAPSPSAGGVVRVEAEQDVDSTDPAIAYTPSSWQLEYATCLKLFNYPDRGGALGSRLEPEAAVELPRPSAGGTVYTIRVRKGFRFSPPSNEPVTAATFKYAIERSLSPRLGPGAVARSVVGGIVGLRSYEAGAAAHIDGVRVVGDTLRIELTHPMPTLPSLLALPFFCAVPVGTPVDPDGIRTIPSAGPYYVAASTPGQGVVLRRNPNYAGRRPHRLGEVDLGVGVLGSTAVADVVAGRADYTSDVSRADAVRLERLYGRARAAADARPRFTVHPTLETYFLAMNTSRPPFSDVRLRKAVNYAIDRRALARLGVGGHPLALHPTDRYVPPAITGSQPARVYPLSPDLRRARRLVAGRHVHAVLYSCSDASCLQKAALIESELARAGIVVEARTMSLPDLFARLGTRSEPFDLAVVGWAADYPDPSDFLNELLDGRSIRAHGNVDYAYFDDPAFNARLAAADRLTGARRDQAYGRLEIQIARDAAPLAAIGNPVQPDLLSARTGCAVYQPLYGIDLAALCVRHA